MSLAGGLGLALMLLDCGADGTTTPTPTPTPVPTPPPPMVVVEAGGPLEFDELAAVPFTLSRTGTLEVTVDWTSPDNSILVIIVRGTCSFDQLLANQCTIAAASEGTSPKPRRHSLGGQAAGPYVLFIGNVGPGDESVSFQVVLRPAAAAATPARGTIHLRPFRRYITFE